MWLPHLNPSPSTTQPVPAPSGSFRKDSAGNIKYRALMGAGLGRAGQDQG